MDAIGWVDADTFYCNAERVRFPMLRDLPLGVLGNNGACVIARTPEMKASASVGDPVWQAKVKCPDGVFLKRDFDWLGDVSGRMLEEIRAYAPMASISRSMRWDSRPSRSRAPTPRRRGGAAVASRNGSASGDHRHRADPDPRQAALRRHQALRRGGRPRPRRRGGPARLAARLGALRDRQPPGRQAGRVRDPHLPGIRGPTAGSSAAC